MRVLLVSSHGADRTRGGAERYVADLARELARRDHDVSIAGAFRPRDRSAAATDVLHRGDPREGRPVRLAGHVRDVVAPSRGAIARLLTARAPDLVHTNNLFGVGPGVWAAAARIGVPVVHTLHDYHLLCARGTLTRRDGTPCQPRPLGCGLRARRIAALAPAVSVVIAVSEHVAHRHSALTAATGAEVRVVPIPLCTPTAPRPQPPGTPPVTVGYLGALTREKGVERLLADAGALAAAGVPLHVAGDGPLAAAVAAHPSVVYAGRLSPEEVPPFLAACDAGLVPSAWEEPGRSYAAAEWLAAGRPVLTSGRGALAEASAWGGVTRVADGPGGIARTVIALRDDPAAWRTLVASVPRVDGEDDRERWVDAHLAAYATARRAR